MAASRCRRLLFTMVSSVAVLVPAAVAAAATCPVRPLPPCSPAAFTGSVRAHSSQCASRPTSVCAVTRGARGLRGLRGVTGTRGAAGRTGARGRIGDTGAAGSSGPQGASGAAGSSGSTGPQGLQGSDGTTGARGASGPAGEQGVAGPTGAAGSTGATGVAGSTGSTGAAGSTGATGSTGPVGQVGTTGETGTAGASGATGPTGANPPAEYAYVYNLTGQTVGQDVDVLFDSNGVMTGGISHTPGGTQISFDTAGDYKATFSVSGAEANQMAFFLNGAPVPGTTYGSGSGTSQNTGQAIFTIQAGDDLTVNNHTSAAAVTLASGVGGVQNNVNASVMIEKIG